MARVDYDVGKRDLGSLYTNLMNALKNKGDAENRRKAEDIERQGLFGSGIKSSDIRDLAQTGRGFIEFGEGRKERKMARATKSFDARMNQAKSRINELRRFGDDDSINEIRAIQAGMSEERNRFENLMSDYEEMGVWESGLGSKGVGYKDTGEMSAFAKAMMKKKDRSGFDRWGDRADAFAQDEASYDYEEKPYTGEFGLSPMSDFKRSDSQPKIPGGPIPTDGDDWERSGQRRRNYIENRGPIGRGRRSNAQSRSYGSEALQKLGPDRYRGPLRRSAQGGMQSQSQLQEKYGPDAYRVEGLMNRDPYKHTFGDQFSSYKDFSPWKG